MPSKSLRDVGSKLTSIDLFGHPIGVHYKGSGNFRTILGSICSVVTLVLIAINTLSISTKFVDHSDQSEFYQQLKVKTRDMEPLVLEE